MNDFVSILGVKGGPSIRPGSNMPTAILLSLAGKIILVDAGLGVSKSVCDQGIALADINEIFITHLHSDHYLELGPLIHTAWTTGRSEPLVVYGPERLKHYWDAFLTSMEDDILLRIKDEGRVDLATLVEFNTINDHDSIELGSVTVDIMRNVHPPIQDSFALKFKWNDKVVVLSGDTAFMPEMINFAKDADLLVHEAMLLEGVDAIMKRHGNADERLREHLLRSHTVADDVGRIAKEANVKQLALNHFVPDGFPEFTDHHWEEAIRTNWSGPLLISTDGCRIAL